MRKDRSVHRRNTDPEDSDFRERREVQLLTVRSMNGHTKWVVGVVSMAIVAALGGLVGLDRAQMVRTGESALAKATINEKRVEVLATDVQGKLSRLQDDVKEIKTLLQEELQRRRR